MDKHKIIKKEETNSILEVCLSRAIPDISTKVLSNTLRALEADALVHREVFPEVPLHVEYQLTDLGHELVPFIVSLTEWAEKHKAYIMEHRKSYKGKKLITE